MEESNQVTFNLTKKFEYAFKGEQREADFVTLTPPTMKQHHQAAALKQSIIRIVTDAVKGSGDKESEEKDESEEVITAKMVVSTIYGSACVEANVVWGQARELLRGGVALIDGEQNLTVPLMEKMNPDDFENMVGEYIANFTLA